MAATVTVGFTSATTPVVSTATAAAPASEGGAPNLFAMLLALVAPAVPPAEGDSPAAAGAALTFAAPNLPAAEPVPVPAASEAPAAPEDDETGRALLKDLGDALLALGDALESGQPVDPALEHKLDETLDALAAWLGIAAPPTAIDPRLAALAIGEALLPQAPTDLPAPAAGADADATEPAPAPAATPAAAATIAPASVSPATPAQPPELATLVADLAEPAAADTATAEPEVAADPALKTARPADASPVQSTLALLIGRLGQRLEPSHPVLAKKLYALAETLKSGKLPEAAADLLGLGDGEAEPGVARLVEAMSTPRPTTTPAPAPQAFTAPLLALPPDATDPPAPTDTDPGTIGDTAETEPSEPAAAERPIHASPVREKPEADTRAAEAKPLSPQPAAATTTAAATPATPTTPADPAVAAAPVARAAAAAYMAPVQQLNMPQVAFELARQFEAGNSRFQIRLDPPEMGRIDVKLDIDAGGTVNARMTVERPETLDLMQRDQRALQQALQQAGLDPARTSLEFSLRQNPFAQQGGMDGNGRGGQPGYGSGNGTTLPEDGPQEAAALYRGTATAGGVNLFV